MHEVKTQKFSKMRDLFERGTIERKIRHYNFLLFAGKMIVGKFRNNFFVNILYFLYRKHSCSIHLTFESRNLSKF